MKRISGDFDASIRSGEIRRLNSEISLTATDQVVSRDIVTAQSSERLPGMDAARGILMLLGIVIHASDIYMVKIWRVHDSSPSIAFDYLGSGIHSFRMEAFFLIAGFFAAMQADRSRPSNYLRHRLQQIVVPLLVTLCTLNALEYALVRPLQSGAASYEWIGHLWFLVDLLVLTLIFVPLLHKDSVFQRVAVNATKPIRTPTELVALLALMTAGVTMLQALSVRIAGLSLNVEILGLTSSGRLLTYAPFFAFGMVAQRTATLKKLFFSIHPALLIPGVGLHAWLAVNATESVSWTLLQISLTILTWFNVAAVIGLIMRCFKRPNASTAWLGNSAYPVYLSHHMFVVAAGSALLTSTLATPIKFLLVVGAAAAASVAFYDVCKRVAWLHPLFTGRPFPKTQPAVREVPETTATPLQRGFQDP